MIDVELLEELEAAATKIGGVKRLPAPLANLYVRSLSETFVEDGAARWWWESLRVPSERLEYGSRDGLSILLDWIRSENSVVLVVTDDADSPQVVYEGKPEVIVEVIRQCRFFEYALAAPDASWIIFDTHMNEFVVAGRLVG